MVIDNRRSKSSRNNNKYNTKIFILLLLVLDYIKALLEIILKGIILTNLKFKESSL
jgi:hypothetical protein